MALPIQNTPVYTLKIPSTKQEVKYRPFLVKEEKALMVAQQSEDQQVMLDTLKEILRGCIKTPIEVDNLAMFDFEYIFSQIRAKSVGENVELVVRCDVCPDEDEKARVKLTFDLTKLEVEFTEGHSKKIPLFADVGVVMKYPSLSMAEKLQNVTNDVKSVFDVIITSIDFIYDGEEIHYAKDTSREELLEFLESLTQDQFQKIQKFFETMPKLSKHVNYDCPVCGHHHEKVVEGLNSFF
jgi:rubrerythrin